MALGAVREADRYLDDPEAPPHRPVCRLDLECVALGLDRIQVDRLEHAAPIALEATREIPDPDAEQHTRVERAAPRDDAPAEAPVRRAAAWHVPRTEREVGSRLAGGEQARHVGRIVREVAVHLEDVLRALDKHVTEAREIRGPEALLLLAVEHRDEVELLREPVRDLAGAVGRVVVDHEHAHAEWLQRAQHRLDVLPLVECREAHGRVRHRGVG